MKKKSPLSQTIGSQLARLQSLVDNVFEFGFKKLKSFGSDAPRKENPETFKEQVVDLTHKSAGFIGDVGSAYYKTYAKLKAKKSEKK